MTLNKGVPETLMHYMVALFGLFEAGFALSQDADRDFLLDPAPFVMPTSSSLSRASSAYSRGLEDAYSNPANIGFYPSDKEKPLVSQLQFPFVGLSMNQNSFGLQNDLSANNSARQEAIVQSVLNAHQGTRQYARASIIPSVVIKKTMFAPIIDHQLAAIPTSDEDQIFVHSQSTAGFGIGSSFSDEEERLSLGFFSYYVNTGQINGIMRYSEMVSRDEWLAAFNRMSQTFTGIRNHFGLTYRPASHDIYTFSVVARDLFSPVLSTSTGEVEGEGIQFEENIGLGMSLKLPDWKGIQSRFNFDMDRLTQTQVAVMSKPRLSFEFLWGGYLHRPLVALRGGFSAIGASIGGELNLGMFAIQAASYPLDLGTANQRLMERRYDICAQIDLVEL